MMRGLAPAFVCLLAAAGAQPACAQQNAAPSPLYLLPRPAETGKPLVSGRYPVADLEPGSAAGCAPVLSCRVQLLGVIEKNGAVMLRGKAFTW